MGAVPRSGLDGRGLTSYRQEHATPDQRYSRTPQQDDQYVSRSGPPGGPPYDPDSEPATQDDLKSLKRWLWVALVWALAASAIGLIALLADDTGNGNGSAAPSDSAAGRIERRLDNRIDELEQKVEDAPSSDEVDDLSNKVEELDGKVADLGEAPSQEDVDAINSRLDELEQRIDDLESQGSGGQPAP